MGQQHSYPCCPKEELVQLQGHSELSKRLEIHQKININHSQVAMISSNFQSPTSKMMTEEKQQDLRLSKVKVQSSQQAQGIGQRSPSQRGLYHKGLKISDFNLIYTLGRGFFAKVFLARLKGQGNKINKLVAIKQIKKKQTHQNDLLSNIKLQKGILKATRTCNFTTQLLCTFRDKEHYYLVMEWAESGDVFSLIDSNSKRRTIFQKIGEPAVRFILGCVILGLESLHERNIVYRDLKPENLLIFKDGYVKLSDFGLSISMDNKDIANEVAGTTSYLAPQMVLQQNYDKSVDLWALGILAYELMNLTSPFTQNQIVDKQIFPKVVLGSEKKRKWYNRFMCTELKDFIDQLLKCNPEQRLGVNSWQQIQQHSFFKKDQFDWQRLSKKQMKSPLLSILKEKMASQKINNNFMQYQYEIDEEQPYSETINDWTSSFSFSLN